MPADTRAEHDTGSVVSIPVTDRELLRRFVSEGSEQAFAEVVARHADMVYATCLRVLGNPEDAEDAAQAVFLILVNKAHRLRRNMPLSGWLFRTAELTARNARRSRVRRTRREKEVRDMRSSGGRKEEAGWEDVRPILDHALAALPARQRDAVVMRYLRGMSNGEVARELGCARTTVISRVESGLEKVRRRLLARGAAVPASVLAGFLVQGAATAAPAGLAGTIQAACVGEAAASAAATSMMEATMKIMMWAKVKMAAMVIVATAAAEVEASFGQVSILSPK